MIAFRSKYPIFVAVIKLNLLKSNKMEKTIQDFILLRECFVPMCKLYCQLHQHRHVEAEL